MVKSTKKAGRSDKIRQKEGKSDSSKIFEKDKIVKIFAINVNIYEIINKIA